MIMPRLLRTKRWMLIGACCGLLLPAIARAEWGFDANAGFAHDDNLPNALEAEDRKGDTSVTANLTGGLHYQLGTNTGLGLNLIADSATYMRYSGLDNLGLGASAQLRHKFGLGPDVPWAALSAQAIHRDYHYDYRDGWQYDAGATVGKQLGERWNVRASVRYDRYTADQIQPTVLPGISTAAYDIAGWNLGAQATFLLTTADLLSVSYAFRNGTVTAVTPPDLEVLEYSSAVARDPVFSNTTTMIAYRVHAKTDTMALGWSHSFSRYAAVNFAYAYRRSRTESELGDYYSNFISISVSYSR
jgi:hypothetical protein